MNQYKATILIVDDTPVNIQVLSGILKNDYHLKVANNGVKAIEIARSGEKIDLILLDIVMPGMDGYQVCRKLKDNSNTNKIPIIFVTARNDVDDEEAGFNLGAVDYIIKPFHPVIVKVRIRNQISLKLKSDLLEDLAQIDGLTQVYNRRHLNAQLPIIFEECWRWEKFFSLVMIDVDYFKNYNDNYGHGMGDLCLIEIAKCLKSHISLIKGALIARYGGEEFVLVLPEIGISEAVSLLKIIIKSVENLQIHHDYSAVSDYITISAGLAILTSFAAPSSFSDMLAIADKALYLAKNNGRNQMAVFVDGELFSDN